MRHVLQTHRLLDLRKAPKKGSKWDPSKVKYLARVGFPGGYDYVRPDPDDVNPNGSLKPGAIKRAFNKFFFGKPYKDKHGIDRHSDGHIIGYKPVLVGAKKKKVGEILSGKKIFRKYLKKKGWTFIQMSPGIASKYQLPAKILELELEAEAIPPTGTPPVEPPAKLDPAMGASVPEGVSSIHGIPEETVATTAAIGAELTEDEDPVLIAQAILKMKLKGKKVAKIEMGKRTLYPLENWAIDKFNEADLADALRDKPVTTLITFGLWAPTKVYKRGKNLLAKEWGGYIKAMAIKAAYAYRSTSTYKNKKKSDEALGINPWSPKSKATRYLNEQIADLTQEGYETLYREAALYTANDDIFDRFDNTVRSRIWNVLEKRSKKIAEEWGATDIAFDEDVDVLARKQGPKYTLSAQEAYDLNHYGKQAKTALLAVVDHLHPTYKRVFESRLWLDDPKFGDETEEAEFYARRKAWRAKMGGSPSAANWERPWTGTGGLGIAAKYPGPWTHPTKPGVMVDLSTMTQHAQTMTLTRWFEAAKLNVVQQLSVPFNKLLHAHVPSSERVKTVTGDRVLLPDGIAVKRWLEVEKKLATLNRRMVSQPTIIPVEGPPIPVPHFKKLQKEKLSHKPEVKYFSNNQKLAGKLGIDVTKFPAFGSPNVDLHTNAQIHLTAAKLYHMSAAAAKKLSTPKLALKVKKLRNTRDRIAVRGRWVNTKKGRKWHESVTKKTKRPLGVTGLHNAAHTVITLVNKLAAQPSFSPADEKALTAASEAYMRVHTSVAKVHKAIAEYYDGKVRNHQSVSSGDLIDARMRAHKLWRHADADAAVHAHEHTQRKAKKSILFADDLVKAIDDYDFELGRLLAALS